MSQTIAVLGAAGVQGGSVVRAFLKDKSWKVRGITRDPSKDAAKALASQGVEVVAANIDDEQSLIKAFEGCQVVFAVTNFWEHMFMGKDAHQSRDIEVEQGIKIAAAASKVSSLKHYIWSSLPGGEKTSNGKFPVPHCDSKAIIDEHIHSKMPDLAKKTTFLWVGFYGTNLVYFPLCKPNMLATAGKYVWIQPSPAHVTLPMAGDVSVNIGVFTHAIVAHPEVSLPAKYAMVLTGEPTMVETLKTWSEVSGKEAEYIEVSPQVFDSLWPKFGGEMAAQFTWGAEVKSWVNFREGLLGAKELGIENELVGFKGCLEGLKEQLV